MSEEWATYEQANQAANAAYLRRGCPDCGDIATHHGAHEGSRCWYCRRKATA